MSQLQGEGERSDRNSSLFPPRPHQSKPTYHDTGKDNLVQEYNTDIVHTAAPTS